MLPLLSYANHPGAVQLISFVKREPRRRHQCIPVPRYRTRLFTVSADAPYKIIGTFNCSPKGDIGCCIRGSDGIFN